MNIPPLPFALRFFIALESLADSMARRYLSWFHPARPFERKYFADLEGGSRW